MPIHPLAKEGDASTIQKAKRAAHFPGGGERGQADTDWATFDLQYFLNCCSSCLLAVQKKGGHIHMSKYYSVAAQCRSIDSKGQGGTQSCLGFGSVCVILRLFAGDLKMHFDRLEKRYISNVTSAPPSSSPTPGSALTRRPSQEARCSIPMGTLQDGPHQYY